MREFRIKVNNEKTYVVKAKDYNQAVKTLHSKLRDFDDTKKNINVVREFITNNGGKFSKSKDADAILDFIYKKTGVKNADYGDVLYIIRNYTNVKVEDNTVTDFDLTNFLALKRSLELRIGEEIDFDKLEEYVNKLPKDKNGKKNIDVKEVIKCCIKAKDNAVSDAISRYTGEDAIRTNGFVRIKEDGDWTSYKYNGSNFDDAVFKIHQYNPSLIAFVSHGNKTITVRNKYLNDSDDTAQGEIEVLKSFGFDYKDGKWVKESNNNDIIVQPDYHYVSVIGPGDTEKHCKKYQYQSAGMLKKIIASNIKDSSITDADMKIAEDIIKKYGGNPVGNVMGLQKTRFVGQDEIKNQHDFATDLDKAGYKFYLINGRYRISPKDSSIKDFGNFKTFAEVEKYLNSKGYTIDSADKPLPGQRLREKYITVYKNGKQKYIELFQYMNGDYEIMTSLSDSSIKDDLTMVEKYKKSIIYIDDNGYYYHTPIGGRGAKAQRDNTKDINIVKKRIDNDYSFLYDSSIKDVDWDFANKLKQHSQEEIRNALKYSAPTVYKQYRNGETIQFAGLAGQLTGPEKTKVLKRLGDSSIKDVSYVSGKNLKIGQKIVEDGEVLEVVDIKETQRGVNNNYKDVTFKNVKTGATETVHFGNSTLARLNDDWSKGVRVIVKVTTESLIKAAKERKVLLGGGFDPPEKFIGRSIRFTLPNKDTTAYANIDNSQSTIHYNMYDDEFTYKEFGGKKDFNKAKLSEGLKKLQDYVVSQLKSAGIVVNQSKVEVGGSSKFNSTWRQAQSYNDESVRDADPVKVEKIIRKEKSALGITYYIFQTKSSSGYTIYYQVTDKTYHGEPTYSGGGIISFSLKSANDTLDHNLLSDKLIAKYGEKEGTKRYLRGENDSAIKDKLSASDANSLVEAYIDKYKYTHSNLPYVNKPKIETFNSPEEFRDKFLSSHRGYAIFAGGLLNYNGYVVKLFTSAKDGKIENPSADNIFTIFPNIPVKDSNNIKNRKSYTIKVGDKQYKVFAESESEAINKYIKSKKQ